jgi:hypothetical protein
VAKRRGPGKAPKGQKKLANQRAKAAAAKAAEEAAQAASESTPTSRAPSASMPQASPSQGIGATMPGYSATAGSQQSQQVSQQAQMPGLFGSGASFDFNFARPSSAQLGMSYGESAEVPREQYTRIFDLPPGLGGYSQPAPYISMTSRMGGGRWARGGPASGGRLQEEGQEFETGSSSSPSSLAGQYYPPPPPPPPPGHGSPGR